MAKSKKSNKDIEKTDLVETATETPKIEEEIKAEEKPKPPVRVKLPQDQQPSSDNVK